MKIPSHCLQNPTMRVVLSLLLTMFCSDNQMEQHSNLQKDTNEDTSKVVTNKVNKESKGKGASTRIP